MTKAILLGLPVPCRTRPVRRTLVATLILAAGQVFALQPAHSPADVPAPAAPGDSAPPPSAPTTADATPKAPFVIPGAPAQASIENDPNVKLMLQIAARELVRVAVLDLRAEAGQPESRDFQIACALLSAARDIQPENVEVVRRHAEAAFSAGDKAQLAEATRRILELDPADTVALLRRISSVVSTIQTVEARLEAYDRLLGPDGQAIDASVRSRLAFDAALLSRERGDDAGFIRRLTIACQLDSTNKEAAYLAYTTYVERGGEAKGRFDLLNNLLMSDPRDFSTHVMLRDECAGAGAFVAAARFHTNAMNIQSLAGNPLSTADAVKALAITWGREGSQVVVDTLNKRLEAERANAKRSEANGGGGGLMAIKPEDVRLDPGFDQMRVAASIACGDQETLGRAIAEFNQTLETRANILADRNRRGAEISDEAAMFELQTIAIDLQLWRLLVGKGDEKIAAVLAESMKKLDDKHEAKRAVLAWNEIRADAPAKAIEILDEPGRDSAWTRMARGTALLSLHRNEEAFHVLWSLSEDEPLSPLGCLARAAASKIEGIAPDPSRERLAKLLEASTKAIPDWVDQIISNPKLFHTLEVTMQMPADKPLVPATAQVRIRNLAPIPLGIGSARTINSRILFCPSISARFGPGSPVAESEVIELNQRLRLMPGEDLVVTVTPDIGVTGWLESIACVEPIRVRYRVLQGFMTDPSGQIATGVGGIDTITPVTPRNAVPLASSDAERIATAIRAAPEFKLPEVLAAARAAMFISSTPDAMPNRAPIVAALVESYPKWNTIGRVLSLSMMPPTVMVPELSAFDEVVRKETMPVALLIAAITRAATPTDSIFEAAAACPDAEVARIIKLHQDRLAAGITTYSTAGVVGPVVTPK